MSDHTALRARLEARLQQSRQFAASDAPYTADEDLLREAIAALARPALSDETLREMAGEWIGRPMSKEPWLHPTMLRAFSVRDLHAFARAVLARQQEGR